MPSQKILEAKKQYVGGLVEKIKASNMGIVVSYKGITVEQDTKLRKEIREAELEYFVVKNSMLRFATKEVGYDIEESLHGTTAIALSKEDPIKISKIITKYVKELKENSEFKIKTGFMEGKVVDVKLINEMGSLPTQEELYAKLLGLLTSPMRMFAVAVKAVAENKASENSGEENLVEESKTETEEKEEKKG